MTDSSRLALRAASINVATHAATAGAGATEAALLRFLRGPPPSDLPLCQHRPRPRLALALAAMEELVGNLSVVSRFPSTFLPTKIQLSLDSISFENSPNNMQQILPSWVDAEHSTQGGLLSTLPRPLPP